MCVQAGWCSELDGAAESVETAHATLDGFGVIAAGEMIGAEIAILDAVFEHMVSGGEHRGGHGENSFLGVAACLHAQELGLQPRTSERTLPSLMLASSRVFWIR